MKKPTKKPAKKKAEPAPKIHIRPLDWKLLHAQKQWLLAQDDEHASGLVHLLDAIQDDAVDRLGIPEKEVFPELAAAEENKQLLVGEIAAVVRDLAGNTPVRLRMTECPLDDLEVRFDRILFNPKSKIVEIWVFVLDRNDMEKEDSEEEEPD